jgi:hypothetical protein
VYQQTLSSSAYEPRTGVDNNQSIANVTPEPVRMQVLDDVFAYGNEFHGIHSTLSITPTTERCFLGIWLALSFKRPVLVQGNVAVGKTHTIKVSARSCQRTARSIVTRTISVRLEFGSFSRPFRRYIRMFSTYGRISSGHVRHWPSCGQFD